MNEICYYDSLKGKLKGSVFSKARKFNKLKLIEEVTPFLYQIHPIPGYNFTTYIVQKDGMDFTCTCQAFTQEKKKCSHVLAISLYLKNKRGEGIEIKEN